MMEIRNGGIFVPGRCILFAGLRTIDIFDYPSPGMDSIRNNQSSNSWSSSSYEYQVALEAREPRREGGSQ